ncbi:MAG: ABC transporter substrate-binding protein [Rhodospirillales bacterium]|nr:ABC transporter substrate-binding protein [Rhodospirillales bacterium]
MKMRNLLLSAAGFAAVVAGVMESKIAVADQFFPMLTYRTGAYAPNGIPVANGFRDYYDMLNKRDGGINGVKISWEECETKYDTKVGVECYEKMKKGATLFNPLSTGITYQLIPKASVDKIPILSMGYGQTAAADGRVFEWIFNFPTTYWSQASAFVKYVASEVGGMDKLNGVHLAHIYHNSAYSKEANPTLEALSEKYGFKLTLIAVDHPGQEQKAAWLQVRRARPDWIFMSGWGVMNQVAIKEAVTTGFPMDHFVGNWWSGSESDTVPAGDGAFGYKSSNLHGTGTDWPVIQDIIKYVYNGDMQAATENKVGDVLFNRGVVNAMFGTEAVRTAQGKYGNEVMSGEQVRWGLENLSITEAKLKGLGMEGFTKPFTVSCADHETGGPVIFQQWTGDGWKFVSDWITPIREVVRPMVEEAAAAYAKENKITPRSCN